MERWRLPIRSNSNVSSKEAVNKAMHLLESKASDHQQKRFAGDARASCYVEKSKARAQT